MNLLFIAIIFFTFYLLLFAVFILLLTESNRLPIQSVHHFVDSLQYVDIFPQLL